jgi:hypothetical protein
MEEISGKHLSFANSGESDHPFPFYLITAPLKGHFLEAMLFHNPIECAVIKNHFKSTVKIITNP